MYEQLREVWNQLTAPGGPFEVTELEVRGIPVRAYATAPPSLRDLWLGSRAHDGADRIRSYELLAGALAPAGTMAQ